MIPPGVDSLTENGPAPVASPVRWAVPSCHRAPSLPLYGLRPARGGRPSMDVGGWTVHLVAWTLGDLAVRDVPPDRASVVVFRSRVAQGARSPEVEPSR